MFDRIRTALPVDRPWPSLAQRRRMFNLFVVALVAAGLATAVFVAVTR